MILGLFERNGRADKPARAGDVRKMGPHRQHTGDRDSHGTPLAERQAAAPGGLAPKGGRGSNEQPAPLPDNYPSRRRSQQDQARARYRHAHRDRYYNANGDYIGPAAKRRQALQAPQSNGHSSAKRSPLTGALAHLLGGGQQARETARQVTRLAQDLAGDPGVQKLVGVAAKSAVKHGDGDYSAQGLVRVVGHMATDVGHHALTEQNKAEAQQRGQRPGRQARGRVARNRAHDQVDEELRLASWRAGDEAVNAAPKGTSQRELARIRRQAQSDYGRDMARTNAQTGGVDTRRERLTHAHAHAVPAQVVEHVTNAPHGLRARVKQAVRQRVLDAERNAAHGGVNIVTNKPVPPEKQPTGKGRGRNRRGGSSRGHR